MIRATPWGVTDLSGVAMSRASDCAESDTRDHVLGTRRPRMYVRDQGRSRRARVKLWRRDLPGAVGAAAKRGECAGTVHIAGGVVVVPVSRSREWILGQRATRDKQVWPVIGPPVH